MLHVMRTIGQEPPRSKPPADRSVHAGELVERILAEFHDSLREIRCAGTERLVKAGVSMSHFHVLGLLSQHGDMTMGRLADLLDISLSNATGLIDRMEERGLIERVRVPGDRRIVVVRTSEGGRSTLDDVEILRHDLLAKLLGRLDESQLERLAQTIEDVRGAVAGLLASEGPEGLTPGCNHVHVDGHFRGHTHAATHH
jgi:DNA-binding MarR family transcriptional regulator